MRSSRILVIEDNPVTRHMLRAVLEGAGYHVDEAPDGPSALARAAEEPPDLVLQDLLLPGTEAADLVRGLRALPNCAGAPFLACTGLMERAWDASQRGLGFEDVLLKPVEPGRLLDVVRAHLARTARGPEA